MFNKLAVFAFIWYTQQIPTVSNTNVQLNVCAKSAGVWKWSKNRLCSLHVAGRDWLKKKMFLNVFNVWPLALRSMTWFSLKAHVRPHSRSDKRKFKLKLIDFCPNYCFVFTIHDISHVYMTSLSSTWVTCNVYRVKQLTK